MKNSIMSIVECGTALHQKSGSHKGITMPMNPKFPKLKVAAGYEAGDSIPNALGWEYQGEKFLITETGRLYECPDDAGYDRQYILCFCPEGQGQLPTIIHVPAHEEKWDLQSLIVWAQHVINEPPGDLFQVNAEWYSELQDSTMEHQTISYWSNDATRLPWAAFRGLVYQTKTLTVQTNGDCDSVIGNETSLEMNNQYENREILIGQNATYIRVSGDRYEIMPESYIATVGKVHLNFVATERLVIARTLRSSVKVAVGYHLTDEELATTMDNEQLCAAAVRKLYSEISYAKQLFCGDSIVDRYAIGRSILRHN